MSLTQEDLKAIRKIVKDEVAINVRSALREELIPIQGELEALRNDIKDIHDMITDTQKRHIDNSKFEKMSLEAKILQLHHQVV